MNSAKRSRRRSATIDRKAVPTSEDVDVSISEDEFQNGQVTSYATTTRTLRRQPNMQHFWWSWISISPLAVALIAISAYWAITCKSSLDSCEQNIRHLQERNQEYLSTVENLKADVERTKKTLGDAKEMLERTEAQHKSDLLEAEKRCFQEKDQAKEKYRSDLDELKEKYRSDLDQAKDKSRSDIQQVKEKCRLDLDQANEKCRLDLDDTKEKCRSDLTLAIEKCRSDVFQANETCRFGMQQASKKCLSDLAETKEKFRVTLDETNVKCRSDMKEANTRFNEEKERTARRIQREFEYLREAIVYLTECLTKKNVAPHGNMFSTMFNAIWNAVKTGLGWNRDIEDCIEQFKNRYQRQIPNAYDF